MKFIEPKFEILSDDFIREEVLNRIEIAARTCYKSEDKICEGSSVKMLNMLIKKDHTAMIEHAPNLSVRFICDRGVSHELTRHRLASFAQESTRYVNYGKQDKEGNTKPMEFIIPEWIQGDDREVMLREEFDTCKSFPESIIKNQSNVVYTYMCMHTEAVYKLLISNGWAPQQARCVLPNSLKTEVVVTANVREWRSIFKLRCAKDAHPQMRELMCPLLIKLNNDIPELWSDIMNNLGM